MLTLPAATPFTVMVIPLTDTVAFVLSADTARKLLSVAPSGWNATVSVVLCPFTTEVLARRHGHAGCRCDRAAIFCHRRASHIGDLHRAGDHFLRRHRFTDTADPATEHIDRAVREADFIGTGITFIKPRQQRLAAPVLRASTPA